MTEQQTRQKCRECGKTGEVRTDNRGHTRCMYCWSQNVTPVKGKPAKTTK